MLTLPDIFERERLKSAGILNTIVALTDGTTWWYISAQPVELLYLGGRYRQTVDILKSHSGISEGFGVPLTGKARSMNQYS